MECCLGPGKSDWTLLWVSTPLLASQFPTGYSQVSQPDPCLYLMALCLPTTHGKIFPLHSAPRPPPHP